MTVDLAQVKIERALTPPRLVMYGPPKIGKTSLLASIPGNITLDVEGGSTAQKMARIEKDKLNSFDDFMAALLALHDQPHDFSSFAIDTVDWLETLIFEQAAKEHGKTSIADVGYGAGYATAQNIWKQVLQAFDDIRLKRGMMVLLVAHEAQVTYNNPMGDNYDRYNIKLRNNDKGSSSASIIKEWCDAMLFINKETFVKKQKEGLKEVKKAGTSEKVFFHTQEAPAYLAGNRYGLPALIPFSWDSLSAEMEKAMTN